MKTGLFLFHKRLAIRDGNLSLQNSGFRSKYAKQNNYALRISHYLDVDLIVRNIA